MISIRLRVTFSFHHCEIPAGTVIAVPPGIAQQFVMREVADLVVEQAVVQPQETRVAHQTMRRGKHAER